MKGNRLIGDYSTLPIGANVSINGCLSVLALRHTGNLSRLYPASHPMVAGIASSNMESPLRPRNNQAE